MAFIFARYAKQLYDPLQGRGGWQGQAMYLVYACAAVVVLTLINIISVRQGKYTQNVLTVVKTLGLGAIIVIGLVVPAGQPETAESATPMKFPLSVAMIFILFTYGGWNEIAYVAAEVKNAKRNILRALVLGTVAVIVLYLLANASFLYSLGHKGMAATEAIGIDTIKGLCGQYGSRLFAVLICISALGAINGLIFAGARISYAVGAEHKIFALLGQWHGKRGTPVRALVVQGAIAMTLIVAFGSFDRTILYTAAAVYLFYLATSLSVIVLRYKDPDVERPFKVTGYPFTPLIFAGVCGFLIYSGINYKPIEVGISIAILLAGLVVYWITKIYEARKARSDANQSS
jgi:amino acid transporter